MAMAGRNASAMCVRCPGIELIFINLGCEDQWRYAPYLKACSNGSRDHPCDDGGEQNPRYH
jgi:hypothetical protein